MAKQGHSLAGYNGANVYTRSYNFQQAMASYGGQNYRAHGNKVYNDVIEKPATTSVMFWKLCGHGYTCFTYIFFTKILYSM